MLRRLIISFMLSTLLCSLAESQPRPSFDSSPQESNSAAASVTPEPTATPEPFNAVTEEQLAQFKFLPSIRLSGRIAFSAKVGESERIFLADLNLKQVRTLVDGPGNYNQAQWSPDGKRLLLRSDRKGSYDLYIVNWDGTGLQRITGSKRDDGDPSWFPDGKSIVFYRTDKDKKTRNLYKLTLGETSSKRLTNFRGKNSTPRVHPNGRRIAFSTDRFWPGWDICIFELSAKKEHCPLQGNNSFSRPVWVGGGKEIMYSSGNRSEIDLYALNMASGEARRLTRIPGREYNPQFDPELGVLYLSSDKDEAGLFSIYYSANREKAPNKLISSPYSVRYLSWTGVTTISIAAEISKEVF